MASQQRRAAGWIATARSAAILPDSGWRIYSQDAGLNKAAAVADGGHCGTDAALYRGCQKTEVILARNRLAAWETGVRWVVLPPVSHAQFAADVAAIAGNVPGAPKPPSSLAEIAGTVLHIMEYSTVNGYFKPEFN